MFCPSCHTQNRDNAKFCKDCGMFFPGDTSMAHVQEPSQSMLPEAASGTQEDDPNLMPTQILSPKEMLAFQTHRWEQAHKATIAEESASTLVQSAQSEDTVATPSLEADATLSVSSIPEHEEQNTMEQAEEQHSEGAIESILTVRTLIIGRYEVTQVVNQGEQENIYQVIDHQGYQRCWNCGFAQNTEEDTFCNDCGAGLLNASYLMHEYPATESQHADEHALHGTVINTFVEQGRTYMIEQPQPIQIAFPHGVHLLAACDSDAGNVRRSDPNEDSTLILQLQRVHESIATPMGVFIVADGLGGHDKGQVASHITISTMTQRLVRELFMNEKADEAPKPLDEEGLIVVFKGAVEEANALLCQTNQRDKTDMGSTITGFMVVGDHAYIINVGDSRTYMLRSGTLYQLTNDHSLVGQLLAGGLIEPDDIYTHPQRSQIYRSLGDKLNIQVDDFKQQLLPSDILLSCSDGLWEMVRNPQITEILSNAQDPQTACTQLIEAANNNGGEDNVSAVVVFVR